MSRPRRNPYLVLLAVLAIILLAVFGFWLDGLYHAWRWGS